MLLRMRLVAVLVFESARDPEGGSRDELCCKPLSSYNWITSVSEM